MSAAKAYQVTFEDRHEYLHARVIAEWTDKRLAPLYLREIIEKCRASGCERILIVRDIPGSISTSLVFLQTGLLEKIAAGLQIAIVDSDPMNFTHLEPGIRYLGATSLNVRAFETNDEADAWLKQN